MNEFVWPAKDEYLIVVYKKSVVESYVCKLNKNYSTSRKAKMLLSYTAYCMYSKIYEDNFITYVL